MTVIDVHCHLEQESMMNSLNTIIEKCRKEGIKAVITSCAKLQDFDNTMKMVKNFSGFVFATVGIHPEFIKEVNRCDIDSFLKKINENKDALVGIGECGLDYWYIKEPEWRDKQAELFRKFISLSKELDKPLVIHAREAYDQVVEILEQENAKQVMLHMFGANHLVKRVIGNGWFVSMNAIVLKSKKHGKVVRDMPIERLMLETDSPWLHPSGRGRNDPRGIRAVAEKIAEIKKISFEDVWNKTAKNALEFFRLPTKI